LLHAFARDVAGDGGVVGLARNFIDLIDIDNAALRPLNFVIAILKQFLNDVFNVFAHVTRLGEGGGIGNHEGHIQQPRQSLCEQCLAGTRGADQQYVALRQLNAVLVGAHVLEPLVVVVDRHGQHALGGLLTDHILVKASFYFTWERQLRLGSFGIGFGAGNFIANDVVAQFYAFITDENRRTCNEFFDLVLTLAAKGAIQNFLAGRTFFFGHGAVFSSMCVGTSFAKKS